MNAARSNAEGKTVVVTGANSGIGRAAAEALARRGAHVVMVCRSRERGEAAQREIAEATGSEQIDLLLADLSVMDEVNTLADAVQQRYDRLDVLVNNAGVYFDERRLTPDGFEYMWALNHLAPFVLTNRLLDLLKDSAPSRVIAVASDAHKAARQIPFGDLQAEDDFNGMIRYGETKLANILFTRELACRLEGTGVTALAMHPGAVASGFWDRSDNLLSRVARLFKVFMTRPETSGKAIARLALDPEFADASGQYFKKAKPAKPAAQARDDEAARRLWDVSEEMVESVLDP